MQGLAQGRGVDLELLRGTVETVRCLAPVIARVAISVTTELKEGRSVRARALRRC